MEKRDAKPIVTFPLGRLLATPGALAALERSRESPMAFIARHAAGAWGEVDAGDRRRNDEAVREGTRHFSAYATNAGERLWVITGGDRSSPKLLLPEEY